MIRFAKQEDIPKVKELWKYCFQDEEAFTQYFFEHRYDLRDNLIAIEKNKIQSSLMLQPYQMTMDESTFSCRYIVGVSSNPANRGKGITRKLMTESFIYMYQQAYAFTFLLPIDTNLYLPYQFSCISFLREYHLAMQDLLAIKISKTDGSFQLFEPDRVPIDVVKKIYNSFVKRKDTYLVRKETKWRDLLAELTVEHAHIVISYDPFDQPNGYMIYYLNNPSIHHLMVREMIGINMKVYQSFLYYLTQHQTQISQLLITTDDDPVLMQAVSYNHRVKASIKPMMMARIIHLEKALLPRTKNLGEKKLIIRVKDPYIPNNNGVFQMSQNSIQKIDEGSKPLIHLELDINQLTSLYFGVDTASRILEAVWSNLAEDIQLIINNLFSQKSTYLLEYI